MTTKNDAGTPGQLQLKLLGPPALQLQGQDIGPQLSARQRALVFMLAVEGRPLDRVRMALMLWADRPEDAARANLRVALTRLRQRIPGVLTTDARGLSLTQGLCINDLHWLGVAQPRSSDAQDSDQEGPADWPGPLLDGFELEGSEAFTQWLRSQRERIGRLAGERWRRQLSAREAAGALDDAIGLARRLLQLDPADESAHMALMRLLLATHRRWAALEQYEVCRQVLAERLGARPSPECYALYVQIHAQAAPSPGAAPLAPRQRARAVVHAELPSAAVVPPPGAAGPASVHPAPAASPLAAAPRDADAALIGRDGELEQLTQMLSQAACRWVSLLGPPGIGKSALARTLCGRLQARGSHDVCWLDASGCAEDWPQLLSSLVQGWGRRADGSARRRLIVLDGVCEIGDAGAAVQGGSMYACATWPSTPGTEAEQERSWLALLEALLEGLPPRLQVLTTGRRPQPQGTGRPQAWRLPLQELSLSASAQLLKLRLLQARAGEPACVADGDLLADRLLRHTGGWPWAVEVAAQALQRLGASALLQELQRCEDGEGQARAGAPHWLDEACVALDVGQPYGLAMQLHDAWQALPLKTQATVQALAALGHTFEAREALLRGATLSDLRLLREHGWLQQRDGGRMGWGVWCRATVASLGGAAPRRPAAVPDSDHRAVCWPEGAPALLGGLSLHQSVASTGSMGYGGAGSRLH